MGQSSSKRGGNASERNSNRRAQHALEAFTHPQGVYAECQWDQKLVRRFILARKLAPMFKGQDEEPSKDELKALQERCRPLLETAGVDLDELGASTEATARVMLVPGMDPVDQASLQDFEECPICMFWYPGGLNRSVCCRKGICTECFLQLKSPTGSTACPFCNATGYAVVFLGPRPPAERAAEEEEEAKVAESLIRQRLEEKESDRRRAEDRVTQRIAKGVPQKDKAVDDDSDQQIALGSPTPQRRANYEARPHTPDLPVPQSPGSGTPTFGVGRRHTHGHRRPSHTSAGKTQQQQQQQQQQQRVGRRRPTSSLLHASSGTAWPATTPPAQLEEMMLREAIRLSLMESQFDGLSALVSDGSSSDEGISEEFRHASERSSSQSARSCSDAECECHSQNARSPTQEQSLFALSPPLETRSPNNERVASPDGSEAAANFSTTDGRRAALEADGIMPTAQLLDLEQSLSLDSSSVPDMGTDPGDESDEDLRLALRLSLREA